MDYPRDLAASSPAEAGGSAERYPAGAPMSGAGQFWWLTDTLPYGRGLVYGVAALLLLGTGFVAGRLLTPVAVREVSVPARAEASLALAEELPSAAPGQASSPAPVLEAGLGSLGELTTPVLVQRQPRLPWRDWTAEQAAYDRTSSLNDEVTTFNRESMAEYHQRQAQGPSTQTVATPEVYWVTRRSPAYGRLARYGDLPRDYLMPGTPLLLQQFDPRWALVMPPGREALWVRATALTTERTYRAR